MYTAEATYSKERSLIASGMFLLLFLDKLKSFKLNCTTEILAPGLFCH